MEVEHLKEFVTFARYMNITHAARKLNVSTSSLSKHLKALEQELGFALISYHSTKLSLTKAGGHYLQKVIPVLDELEKAMSESKAIEQSPTFKLVIQQPAYPDESALKFYQFVKSITDAFENITTTYVHGYRKLQEENLKEGRVHLLIKYELGNPNQLMHKFSADGFASIHLASIPLAIWCNRSNRIATRGYGTITDFATTSILLPNEPDTPLRSTITKLCKRHDITPSIVTVNAATQKEFYLSSVDDGVFVLPYGLDNNDILFRSRNDMVFIPLEERDASAEAFALAYTKSDVFEYLQPFFPQTPGTLTRNNATR